MPIHYQLFDFACPPRTGTMWIIKAAQLSGFGVAFKHQAHMPFSSKSERDIFRVSLVRHPCDWLASCFASIRSKVLTTNHLSSFTRLDVTTFDDFVRQYLSDGPNLIGRLYNRYEADSCFRIEDMPWAFVELLEELGIPPIMRDMCKRLGKQNMSGSLPSWDKGLWKQVMRSESEICEAYDYC